MPYPGVDFDFALSSLNAQTLSSRSGYSFFLPLRDETSGILKAFITEIENQLDHKVEAARTMKRDNTVARQAEKKIEPAQEYILIHICTTDPLISQYPKVSKEDAEEKSTKMDKSGASNKDREDDQATRSEFERLLQQEKHTVHTNSINTASTPVSTTRPSCTDDDLSSLVNAAEASNAFEEHLFE
ncbi:hypothetical protein Tco_1304592 [Tanacetum coccineum]